MAEILDVVCVLDDCGFGAIYINGELKAEHDTSYMGDLVAVIDDEQQAFRLRQVDVEYFEGDWPKRLEELKVQE